jgi:hypothetical protein
VKIYDEFKSKAAPFVFSVDQIGMAARAYCATHTALIIPRSDRDISQSEALHYAQATSSLASMYLELWKLHNEALKTIAALEFELDQDESEV